MMHEEDEDAASLPEVRSLSPELTPPADLEHRTVAQLRRAGLLSPPAAGWPMWRPLFTAALVALAFVAGFFAGGRQTATVAPPQTRYVLLLYPGEMKTEGPDEGVEAYRQWAIDVRSRGLSVTGERLSDQSAAVGPPISPDAGDRLQGFFIISAADDREARALAAAHPHVRRGGQIVIKRIEPT